MKVTDWPGRQYDNRRHSLDVSPGDLGTVRRVGGHGPDAILSVAFDEGALGGPIVHNVPVWLVDPIPAETTSVEEPAT